MQPEIHHIWHSLWKRRLPPWARFVAGPYLKKRFGSFGARIPM